MPRISARNRITVPVRVLGEAGLAAGDEVRVEAAGPGRIVVRKLEPDFTAAFGIFSGLYQPDYLDRLRADERA